MQAARGLVSRRTPRNKNRAAQHKPHTGDTLDKPEKIRLRVWVGEGVAFC